MKLIYQKKWYTPKEVAKLGLIQNRKGDRATVNGNYNYVLELIKSGELKAKNYSTGKIRAFYLISEDEIERYHKSESEG